ncbi:hypothetical protein COX24_00710 [bacterium (Candidatus Gribaldobacteria) CG23_combo_of_CG06-09_8_20_14_all_37_87_8]|uniref:Uncharacterized protein n=1 Tax=bacterium (Candidatus Gribaldobacteria) CG23_combo_of_CG06-09_8_20_14_all_37_87_8 TaxID=2014278 RepID=A0A2G9ZHA3_9BACT|nr:MAG: hypothetical protein COX24_00710 [bacterium (Candidatus Gribaldobacteria) CG23_combo_of_CG06-09_8_20_14_all_37_87_8]
MYFEVVFSRRVSSFFSLLIIFLLALIVGSWALYQSAKLTKLEEPLPLYIKLHPNLNIEN